MRRAGILLAILTALSCAEGGITGDGEGPDETSTTGSGSRADCISGVTCADEDCIDNDDDGFGVGCILGDDCDDSDRLKAPNVSELCDGKDNNCDGAIDENAVCTTQPPSNNNSNNPPPPGCNDADGDGYGLGCAAGTDCDDADRQKYEGAPEACDGKDNDCDGTIDEDFELGMTCTAGLGACEGTGAQICSADGTMSDCSAQAGTPSTEVCDRVDNDCDGMVDDGLNCPACIEDGNEPDNSSLAGTTLNVGSSVNGQLCPSDVDWFRLGDYTVGQTVSVTALFSHAQGDINIEMYVGSSYETGSYSGSDNESINKAISKSGPVAIRVYYASAPGASGNSYTMQR
jgi:hypothetical protein